MIVSLMVIGELYAISQTPILQNAMPLRVTGAWTIEVGPGTVVASGKEIRMPQAVSLSVAPPDRVEVRDEPHSQVPVFNEKAGGWIRGAKLKRLITEECTATGLLYPDSVRVKSAPGDSPALTLGKDYQIDPFWATFGLIEGGNFGESQTVYVDYDYCPLRLDSIVVDGAGQAQVICGEPGMGALLPPEAPAGTTAVANVFLTEQCTALTDENLYPIEFGVQPAPVAATSVAETLLPKTLAKLRAGDPVAIVAWGDSVTGGGGVNGHEDQWYQHQFVERLRARFSKAAITLRTAAWPGGNSAGYMAAPKGGVYDYERDVLAPKPDLVTIEFVNDAYLDEAGVKQHYGKILADLRGNGAEVILITPHLVRPDWLGSDTLKVDTDPRPYVRGLREFAAENRIAVADASKEWCRLWRKGIPYTTLLANSINHPDERGHRIFADVLMALFPAE